MYRASAGVCLPGHTASSSPYPRSRPPCSPDRRNSKRNLRRDPHQKSPRRRAPCVTGQRPRAPTGTGGARYPPRNPPETPGKPPGNPQGPGVPVLAGLGGVVAGLDRGWGPETRTDGDTSGTWDLVPGGDPGDDPTVGDPGPDPDPDPGPGTDPDPDPAPDPSRPPVTTAAGQDRRHRHTPPRAPAPPPSGGSWRCPPAPRWGPSPPP